MIGVPAVWFVTVPGTILCLYTMYGLPPKAWKRFAIWLAIGLALYFAYGYRHSTLRGSHAATVEHPRS